LRLPSELYLSGYNIFVGGAEFAGPVNDEPQNNNTWKMQDLKMTDKITGPENRRPNAREGQMHFMHLHIFYSSIWSFIFQDLHFDFHGVAVSWSLIFSRSMLGCLLFADDYIRRCRRIIYIQEDAALNEHGVTHRHILSASLATAEADERIEAFVHKFIRIA